MGSLFFLNSILLVFATRKRKACDLLDPVRRGTMMEKQQQLIVPYCCEDEEIILNRIKDSIKESNAELTNLNTETHCFCCKRKKTLSAVINDVIPKESQKYVWQQYRTKCGESCENLEMKHGNILLGAFLYTLQHEKGGTYRIINTNLQLTEKQEPGFALILHGMLKLEQTFPAPSGKYYRGMNYLQPDTLEQFKTIGFRFRFLAFTSCTQSQEVARDFQKKDSGLKDSKVCTSSVLFEIDYERGRGSNHFASLKENSFYPEEEEFIFFPMSCFEVSSFEELDPKEGNGQAKISLKSIEIGVKKRKRKQE